MRSFAPRLGLTFAAAALSLWFGSGCRENGSAAPRTGGAGGASTAEPAPPATFADDGPEPVETATTPRGLGTMTARVPGTKDVVGGVHLTAHHVRTTVKDGFARTEIEEVFANDSAQALEGRYVFPVPPAASLTRLALWVGDKLVEGEIVEKTRAKAIFKGIVEDTVRPRDPALLEWTSGGRVALKVFPLPPKGTRKVVLAYDEVLSSNGGTGRYVLPLAVGADRALRIADFSIDVSLSEGGAPAKSIVAAGVAATVTAATGLVHFEAKDFAPAADLRHRALQKGKPIVDRIGVACIA